MKLSLSLLLGMMIMMLSIHSPLWAVDEVSVAPDTSAASKDKVAKSKDDTDDTDKDADEGKPPSQESTNVAKKALASVVSAEFDPQTYTCKQFLKETSTESGLITTAIIWTHGYFSATYGTDDVGPLNEETLAGITQDLTDFCTENTKMNFSRAVRFISRQ